LKNKWNLCRVPLNQLAEKGWDATFWKVWEQLYLALSAQVYMVYRNSRFRKNSASFRGNFAWHSGEDTQTNIYVRFNPLSGTLTVTTALRLAIFVARTSFVLFHCAKMVFIFIILALFSYLKFKVRGRY
jgi:hypothetical protein